MIVDKYFNFKINAFVISTRIIKILKKRKNMRIDSLFNEIANYYEEMNHQIFNESIGLLFLTGKIDYNLDTDNMELKNEIN